MLQYDFICTVLFAVEIIVSDIPEIGMHYNLTCFITNLRVEQLIITYQWYKDGAMFSGANESTLVLQSLTHADAGEYVCEANLTSEHLIPSFQSIKTTYQLCFSLGNYNYATLCAQFLNMIFLVVFRYCSHICRK